MDELTIPVHVLIRPRSGNFTYSDAVFEIMKENILLCKELGCTGIVSGVLNSDNTLDATRTEVLVQYSGSMSFTFHRGFDWIKNPFNALSKLEEIGVHRILTSGQQPCAMQGLNLLKELQKKTTITIMPGGGISTDNAIVFKENGFSEIHASLTALKKVNDTPKISMNSSKHFTETQIAISSSEKIKQLLKNIL